MAWASGDHVDFQPIGHAGFLEIGAEGAIDDADGGKILHAGKADRLQLVEEHVHQPEGIGAVDAGEDRRVLDDGQHLGGHVDDDLVGIAIGIRPASEPRPAIR